MYTSGSGVPVTGVLNAVLDHLNEYALPEPYGVQAYSGTVGSRARVSVHLAEFDLAAVAGALTTWAATLSEASLSIWRPPSSGTVYVQVPGRLPGGVPIEVWAGVKAPAWAASMEPGQTQALPLGQLRTWAATPAAEQPTANAQAGGAA